MKERADKIATIYRETVRELEVNEIVSLVESTEEIVSWKMAKIEKLISSEDKGNTPIRPINKLHQYNWTWKKYLKLKKINKMFYYKIRCMNRSYRREIQVKIKLSKMNV